MSGGAGQAPEKPAGRAWRKGLTGQVKTRGTDWWTPEPGTPLNAGVFYVVQIADDAFSLTERLIHRAITAPECRLKNSTGDRGFLCDPGGYTALAKRVGVCRKTVYNTIKSLIRKGALREFRIDMKGKQRTRTIYYATHFGDLLPIWRADPKLFHTAVDNRIVVKGRRKEPVTVEAAALVAMDPRRAPLRGCGAGRGEFEQRQKQPPPPAPEPLPSNDEIEAVRKEFLKWAPSNLKDWIDVIHAARREAPAMPVHILTAKIAEAARSHKPSSEHPTPKAKWIIDRVAPLAAQWEAWVKGPAGGYAARFMGKDLGTFETQAEADAAVMAEQRRKLSG